MHSLKSSNIQVSIRVRPLSKKELALNDGIIVDSIDTDQIRLHNPKLILKGNQTQHDHRDRTKLFTFDHCYFSVNKNHENYATQQTIFDNIGEDVLTSFIEGYNTCILCYGQTGTGKTYTMMGSPTNDQNGLTPRVCEDLFKRIKQSNSDSATLCCKTLISYMEIYNEKARDLLEKDTELSSSRISLTGSSSHLNTLKIREHPTKGVFVQNLSQYPVTDLESTMKYLIKGNQNRSTASTHVHDKSSRSHAIFTITVVQAKVENEIPVEIMSKLHLVDLAGSERAASGFYCKKQLKEGSNINKSLVSLGNVISILAENTQRAFSVSNLNINTTGLNTTFNSSTAESTAETKTESKLFIPYRDSMLTYLLKDSLGGNSQTHMIANISPASRSYHETLNTLLFAQRAKKIVNKPKINEDPKTALIKELRQEINQLKQFLMQTSSIYSMPSNESIDALSKLGKCLGPQGSQLHMILQKNEQKAKELTLTWIDKWNTAEDDENSIMITPQPSMIRSKRFTSGYIVQSDLPYLISLNDDPLSSEIMIYNIKLGETLLGSNESICEIVLRDDAINGTHCCFENIDGLVTLKPMSEDSEFFVNNVNVKTTQKLSQGDFITMGKSIFRFNHPEEAARLREQKESQPKESSSRSGSAYNINCTLSLKSQSMPTLYMKNDPVALSLFSLEKNEKTSLNQVCNEGLLSSSKLNKSISNSVVWNKNQRTLDSSKEGNLLPAAVALSEHQESLEEATSITTTTAKLIAINRLVRYDLNEMNDYHQTIKTSTKSNEDQMQSTADLGGDQQLNDKEHLHKLQVDLKNVIMNIIGEIHLVKTMFQVEQIKCKQNFDIKSNNFMNIIQQEPDKSLDLAEQCFNPDVLLSSNERKAIDYIDTFKVSSDAGVLKYKLNLELIFFTELKSLRVDYISQMNLLNDKLAASKQECIRMVNIIPEQQQQQQSTAKTNEFSSDSAINFDSGSFQTNKVSKPSSTSLTLIDSVCSESEDDGQQSSNVSSSNFTNITSAVNSNHTIKIQQKANRRSAIEGDLFSSVISSIDSADEQPTMAESAADMILLENKSPLNSKTTFSTMSSSNAMSVESCQKCLRRRNYRVSKSTSDISFKVNYFLTSLIKEKSTDIDEFNCYSDTEILATVETDLNLVKKNDDASLTNRKPTQQAHFRRKRPMNPSHQHHNHNTASSYNQPRVDNSHTTFVNCLRNWDDPYLQGVKPIKQIACTRCDGCGCRLNSSGNSESSPLNHHQHHHNEFSSSCSSSSEHNNSMDRHYLCNTHSSNLNRHLSVNNLTQRAARAEANLITSKLQPMARSKSSINVRKGSSYQVASSKLNKSRPKPSSNRPHGLPINDASKNKRTSSSPEFGKQQMDKQAAKTSSNQSFDSDKDSVVTNSNFVPSDTSTAGSVKSSEPKSKDIEPGFLLPRQHQQRNLNKSSTMKKPAGIENPSFKSSTSSLNQENENDLIEFEDSLQESFDSDSLMVDSSNENKSIISLGSNLQSEDLLLDEENPFILSSSLKQEDENNDLFVKINKDFKFVQFDSLDIPEDQTSQKFGHKFSQELRRPLNKIQLQQKKGVNKPQYRQFQKSSVFNVSAFFRNFTQTGSKQKNRYKSINGDPDRRSESVKSTIRLVRTERNRKQQNQDANEQNTMPMKATTNLDSPRPDSNSTRRNTNNESSTNKPFVDAETQNIFQLYKVVLRKTSPDTWHSGLFPHNTSQADNDEADNHIEIFYNQPTEKHVNIDILGGKTFDGSRLAISESDAWSNMVDETDQIASSLADTMGSIVDKIENDLRMEQNKLGHYLSVSERRPSSMSERNFTQSSGMFSDINNKSEEESSLKSFEMNELINDISDDSMNNESTDSLPNIKVVCDSGYMTSQNHQLNNANNTTFNSSQNELCNEGGITNADTASSSHSDSDQNDNEDVDMSPSKIFTESQFVNEEDDNTAKQNGFEDLTKVTSIIDSYATDSDNSCASLGEQFNSSHVSDVVSHLLKELVSEVSCNQEKIDTDKNNASISTTHNRKQEQNISVSGNHSKENKVTDDKDSITTSDQIHEHRRLKLRRRRSRLLSATETTAVDSLSCENVNEIRSRLLASHSPVKKRSKRMTATTATASNSIISDVSKANSELNTYYEDEEDEDEFFLAINSDKLETGSCPNFFFYPDLMNGMASSSDKDTNYMSSCHSLKQNHRAKSLGQLHDAINKSYENITHTTYVHLVESMITGAISDAADQEYVQYIRRHIQGLFENYAPLTMKSRSNEEFMFQSQSRDEINDMIQNTMPKSLSLDLQLLEESKQHEENNQDAMDFSKFGLGIDTSVNNNNDSDADLNTVKLSTPTSYLEVKVPSNNSHSSSDSSHSPQLNESQNSECIVDEFDNHYKDMLMADEEENTAGNVTVVENTNFQPQRHRSSSFNSDNERIKFPLEAPPPAEEDELFERPVARLDFIEPELLESINQSANPAFNDTRKSLEGSTSSSEESREGSDNEVRQGRGLDNENESNDDEDGNGGRQSSPQPDNSAANISTDGSVDDLIIECKVDYYLKDSEDSSSMSDSSSSSDSENEAAKSKPVVLKAVEAASSAAANVIVVPAAEDKILSSTSADTAIAEQLTTDNVQSDEDCENNENGELLDFEFMDEDEMNQELDDNWISEDDILYGQIMNMKKQAAEQQQQQQQRNSGGFYHQPRILHRIEEEKSEKSSSEGNSDSSSKSSCKAAADVVADNTQAVAEQTVQNKLVGFVEDISEFSKLKVKFKYTKDDSRDSEIKQPVYDELVAVESLSSEEDLTNAEQNITNSQNTKPEIDIELEYESCNSSASSKKKPNEVFNTVNVQYATVETEEELNKNSLNSKSELVLSDAAAAKQRAVSGDLATENDAYSDFEEVDFSEEDREVTGIEQNVCADDIVYRVDPEEPLESEHVLNGVVDEVSLDQLAADLVHRTIQASADEQRLDKVATSLVNTALQTTADEERLDKMSFDVVEVALEKAQTNEMVLKSVQAVIQHALDTINDPAELVVDYVVEQAVDQEVGSSSDLLLCDSSNEAFEIQYEFIGQDELQRSMMRKAESELDISNLELKICQANENDESVDESPLAQILFDIEKEIIEKRTKADDAAFEANRCFVNNEKDELLVEVERPVEADEFEEDYEKDEVEEVEVDNVELSSAKLPESVSWPLLKGNTEYDLNGSEPADVTDGADAHENTGAMAMSQSITADRLSEAKLKYNPYLTRPMLSPRSPRQPRSTDMLSLNLHLNNSQYLSDSEDDEELVKIDQSNQVNPADLTSNMKDDETQMTPPISPLKQIKLQLTNIKVDMATETDNEIIYRSNNSLHIVEEKQQQILPITSSSTQTTFAEATAGPTTDTDHTETPEISTCTDTVIRIGQELPIANQNIKKPLVKVGGGHLESDLNDEQCLILLHGMKRMDDEFKSELKSLTDEEMTKSELFRLIKNFSTLSPDERKRLEYLIISNLNKSTNKEPAEKADSNWTQARRPSKEVMKIQNASLDSYLQTLLNNSNKEDDDDDDDERKAKKTSSKELLDDVDAETELNLSYNGPRLVKNVEFGVQVELATTAGAKNKMAEQEKKDLTDASDIDNDNNNKQISLVVPSGKNQRPRSPVANQHNQLAVANNYSSHFIDLLSLNLDRSKTWVEMTEAKLNYMIGETDAVLRSMCFDSSEDEELNKTEGEMTSFTNKSVKKSKKAALLLAANANSNKQVALSIETEAPISPSMKSIKMSALQSQRLSPRPSPRPSQDQQQLMLPMAQFSNRSSSPALSITSETANSTIQEMTKLYLDNYKRQLQDSKSELNSRMSLLDKEKEKVSRIRDNRKRELYMRRQATIEAFRQERERELNAQISKIDTLKSELASEKEQLNLSIVSQQNVEDNRHHDSRHYQPTLAIGETLPYTSSNGAAPSKYQSPQFNRLANLRRNNLLTNGTQSDFFGETNSQYLTPSYLNFENESFVHTPRSSRSTVSFIDPIHKGAASHVLSQINPAELSSSPSRHQPNRYQSDLNKENNHNQFNSNSSYMSRSSSNFLYPSYKPYINTNTNNNNITSSRGYSSRNLNKTLSPSKYTSTSPYRSTSNNYLSSLSPSPRVRNVSFSKQDTYDQPIRSPRSTTAPNYQLNSDRSTRSNDTARLLMPVISTTLTTTTTTTNVISENDRIMSETKAKLASPSTSIVDESKSLLKEYEQLRTDSVSEIQRAHDSLNASLKWLENQKLNRMRTLLSEETSRSEETSNIISGSGGYNRFHSNSFLESSPQRYDKHTPGQSLQIRRDDLSPVSRFREENTPSYTASNNENLYGQKTSTTTTTGAKNNKYTTSNLLKQSLSKRKEPILSTGQQAPYYYEPGESPSAAYTSRRYGKETSATPISASTASKTYDVSKYSSSRHFTSSDIDSTAGNAYISSSYSKINFGHPISSSTTAADSAYGSIHSPSTKFPSQSHTGSRTYDSGNKSFRVEYSDNEEDKVF